MWILSFDTTTSFCQIALLNDQKIVQKFHQEMTFGQSEVLIPEIKNMLDMYHLNMNDVSLINVCTGPGSFTGVRSSIAAARGFALGNPKVALCGINAFDTYIFDLKPQQITERNVVLIETKREDFYVACYNEKLEKTEEPKTAYRDEIIKELKGYKVTFTGDGVERFLSESTGLQIHDVVLAPYPDIQRLSLIGLYRMQEKRLDFPKPLYLKAADVCIK